MRQSPSCERRLRNLIGTDLPADELEQLARADALLRVTAARDCGRRRRPHARAHVEERLSCRSFEADAETGATTLRATLSEPLSRQLAVPLATAPAFPSRQRLPGEGVRPRTYELKLGFGELALVYKSLQAVKTLGALPPQDELLNDTIQLVDQALRRAI